MRTKAVGIFRQFLKTFASLRRLHPSEMKAFLDPLVPAWMTAFEDTLGEFEYTNTDRIQLTVEVFMVLFILSSFNCFFFGWGECVEMDACVGCGDPCERLIVSYQTLS
jgi:hypothetical protein